MLLAFKFLCYLLGNTHGNFNTDGNVGNGNMGIYTHGIWEYTR